MDAKARRGSGSSPAAYRLDEQIGFILRQVGQRHASIFAAGMDSVVTPTQWAALAKLAERGPLSQNRLGRLTVMDAATVKGVIDRLTRRGFTGTSPDPADGRRRLVALTPDGEAFVARRIPDAVRITAETLAPFEAGERDQLVALLMRMR